MKILDMYNKLAVLTGFPLYTNDTDTPDTQRTLLRTLSSALQNIIDGLYLSNNIFEREDVLTTIPNQSEYGVRGLIKNVQYKNEHGKFEDIPFINNIDFLSKQLEERTGKPEGYVIKGGYLKLVPVPDKSYDINVTVSTTDLIMADDDTSRETIEDINDIVVADDRFCELVVLRAAQLLFAISRNANADVYNGLVMARIKTYVEMDYKTMEAERGFNHQAGHYDPKRGLLG